LFRHSGNLRKEKVDIERQLCVVLNRTEFHLYVPASCLQTQDLSSRMNQFTVDGTHKVSKFCTYRAPATTNATAEMQ